MVGILVGDYRWHRDRRVGPGVVGGALLGLGVGAAVRRWQAPTSNPRPAARKIG